MSIRARIKRLERQQADRPCPECATTAPVKMIENFDDSPLPPEDTRTFEELCKIQFCEHTTENCPRCGQPRPVQVIEILLHPAYRHPDYLGRACG